MMTQFAKNLISCGWSIIRLSFLKLFCGRRFSFRILERISPNAGITMLHGGEIHIGYKLRMHHGSSLNADGGKIILGDDVRISTNVGITSLESIQIGDHAGISTGVLIYDHDHDFRQAGGYKNAKFKTAPVVIGNNVWIGANSIILRGTVIGDNSVIGAGTIVTGVIPPNSIVTQKRENIVREIQKTAEKRIVEKVR